MTLRVDIEVSDDQNTEKIFHFDPALQPFRAIAIFSRQRPRYSTSSQRRDRRIAALIRPTIE